MNTVAERLHTWAVQELNLVSEGRLSKIPDADKFKCLTEGKNKRIWNYVINHVRSQSEVEKVKRVLRLKKYRDTIDTEYIAPFNKVHTEIVTLETTLVKATEKRTFLKQTLSSIEKRLTNLEQQIEHSNYETKKENQKSAFLEVLSIKYSKSNTSLKVLFEKISCHLKYFRTYQSCKVNPRPELSLLFGRKFDSGFDCGVKEIISVISAIVENKVTNQNLYEDKLHENLHKKNSELKVSCFLLNDLVHYLRTFSDSDRQQFAATNLQQNVLKKVCLSKSKQTDPAEQIVSQMKYDSVHHSLSMLKNKNEISKLLVTKNEVFKIKTENLRKEENICDFEIRVSLLEKLTENKVLVISNEYLEEMLKTTADKTEIFKQNCEAKNSDLNSNIDNFYKYLNATFYLLNTAPSAFQKVINDLNKLQAYTRNELFYSEHMISAKEIAELKSGYVTNMTLVWDFLDKLNMIEPLKSEPYNFGDSVTPDTKKLLNIEPFENVGNLGKKIMDLKEFLRSEAVYLKPFANDHNISTSEIYSHMTDMLSKSKAGLESALLYIDEGMKCCLKNKTLVQEWWEQNAQFVQKIEHEGKSLKMWIDILYVLNEFEPKVYQ